jgi:hypothetical protein
MIFRLYNSQLDALASEERQRLEACASSRTDKWIDVHKDCYKNRSRGLGDTIAKVTSAMGIKPCGDCKERQKMFNELFPYRRKKNDAPTKT